MIKSNQVLAIQCHKLANLSQTLSEHVPCALSDCSDCIAINQFHPKYVFVSKYVSESNMYLNGTTYIESNACMRTAHLTLYTIV